MSFESFLEKITTPASPDNVLVCEASFNGLRAVVVDKKGDKLTLGQEVSSELFDLDEAVEELVKKVRQMGWKGEHAIMVSPAVCMSVLALSIPAKNKLPIQQVTETMQWEIEPAYNQHKTILVIGQLLQLMGYLSEEQVAEILTRQNELINSKNSTVTYKRFGELALEAGFLTPKQLDASLSRQQWFTTEGDELKCGGHPLEQQPMADANEYKWVVAAVNQDLLRTWQAVLSKHEVKLDGMYPLAGSGEINHDSLENTGQTVQSSREILLEIHHGMIAASLLVVDEPMKVEAIPSTDTTVLANVSELITALSQDDDLPIRVIDCLHKNEQQSAELEADIKTMLDKPIERIMPSGKVALPMRNAVRNFFRVKNMGYVEKVSAYDSLPPVMQRFSVRTVLAGFLILSLIAISELSVFASGLWIKTSIASISEDVNRIRTEKKRINTKISTVTELKGEVDKKQAEKKGATTMISLLTKELPERNQMLSQLMMRLQESVTQDIVINSITEDTLLGFNFDAWALSDQSAQSFIKKFQLAIHPMDFRIKNLTVKEQTGRLGLIGYSVRFSITQHSEAELNARVKRAKTQGY